MKGLISRGNGILALSWAMALGMFVVRAGKTDGGGPGGAKAPAHGGAAAGERHVAGCRCGAGGGGVGRGLTRNDAPRALQ